MPLQPLVKSRGLWTHPNKHALPEGALLRAANSVCQREGVIGRRRGFARYGAALSAEAREITQYLERLVVFDGTNLVYDSDGTGTWSSWTGTFDPPSGEGMRFLEANGNLYFTTDAGVFVQTSLTGTPVRSGLPQGLDCQLEFDGTGGGWFTPDTQVGYRHTWSREDASDNLKTGAPSFQERLTNPFIASTWTRAAAVVTINAPDHTFSDGDEIEIFNSSSGAALPDGVYTISNVSGDDFDVTGINAGDASGTADVGKHYDVELTVTLPDDVAAGDILEIWRTPLSATADTPPGENHRRILRRVVLTADVTAGFVALTDDRDESFFEENLYTNPNQEGEAQANHRPPLARYLTTFEGHTFYAGATQPHLLRIQLVDVTGLVADTSTFVLTQGATVETYTASTAVDLGAKKFEIGTSGILAVDVETTAKSLAHVINRTSAVAYSHYTSAEDEAPGFLLLESRAVGAAEISVTGHATTSDQFDPVVPTSGVSLSTEADSRANAIWRSKFHQPEAVPRLNENVLGSRNYDVQGIVSLREALLVWREDGLFSISGRTDGASGAQFVDDDVDPTVHVRGTRSLVRLDNAAFAHTDQGVLRAGQGSPAIVSRPQIETELRRLATFTAFSTIAFAVPYESDRSYLFWLKGRESDTFATMALVYNYATNAWSSWTLAANSGHVLSADDKLYVGHADSNWVLQERKTLLLNGNDFQDENLPITITVASTTTHPRTEETVSYATFTSANYTEPEVGDGITQGSSRTVIDVLEDLGGGTWRATCRHLLVGLTAAAATLDLAIPFEVEWAPINTGSPASMKQFGAVQIYPERDGGTHQLATRSDLSAAWEYTQDIVVVQNSGWGYMPWGLSAWGGTETGSIRAIRSLVPDQHRRARSLGIRFRNRYCREPIEILCLGVDVRPHSSRTEIQPE